MSGNSCARNWLSRIFKSYEDSASLVIVGHGTTSSTKELIMSLGDALMAKGF